MEFYLNGIRLQRWSGEVGWQNYQFPVTAGLNRFEWRYTKDANFSSGLDAAYLDKGTALYARKFGVPRRSFTQHEIDSIATQRLGRGDAEARAQLAAGIPHKVPTIRDAGPFRRRGNQRPETAENGLLAIDCHPCTRSDLLLMYPAIH